MTAVSPRKARRLPADIPRKPRGGVPRAQPGRPGGDEGADGPALRLGPERAESAPDGDWVIRLVPGAGSTKTYRCPGCDQEIPPGTAHLVAWPAYTSGPAGPPSLAQSLLAAAAAAAHARQPGRKVTGGMGEIRASTVLPARREPVTLHTADGLSLVGELALPAGRDPVATLIWLHPLPTQGGMMDSHLLRKASYRLPALAGLAVFRFNTRGTASERGRSEGTFDGGDAERYDVAAAVSWCQAAGLPRLWLVGWSFGTELVLRWGNDPAVEGAILLSPPLRRADDADLDAWAASGSRSWSWCPASTTTCSRRRRGSVSPACRRPN